MNSLLPSSLDVQQKDPPFVQPADRDPNKAYPYVIFLKMSAPTTEAANQDAQDFAKSVGINLVKENVFRMSDSSVNLFVDITPKQAAELERDPRVRFELSDSIYSN
jgi:hypothetical protein